MIIECVCSAKEGSQRDAPENLLNKKSAGTN